MANELEKLSQEVHELFLKEKEIEEKAREYCKDKKFKIVKPIYYSGYQGNMIGRECVIHPHVNQGELLANCTVYNKRTGKIDIKHYYLHPLDFYEEVKE